MAQRVRRCLVLLVLLVLTPASTDEESTAATGRQGRKRRFLSAQARRDSHNKIELRRSRKIQQCVTELRTLLQVRRPLACAVCLFAQLMCTRRSLLRRLACCAGKTKLRFCPPPLPS